MPRPFGLPVEVKTCGLEMEMQDVFSNSISTPGNKKWESVIEYIIPT
jgi:hypothetical protein